MDGLKARSPPRMYTVPPIGSTRSISAWTRGSSELLCEAPGVTSSGPARYAANGPPAMASEKKSSRASTTALAESGLGNSAHETARAVPMASGPAIRSAVGTHDGEPIGFEGGPTMTSAEGDTGIVSAEVETEKELAPYVPTAGSPMGPRVRITWVSGGTLSPSTSVRVTTLAAAVAVRPPSPTNPNPVEATSVSGAPLAAINGTWKDGLYATVIVSPVAKAPVGLVVNPMFQLMLETNAPGGPGEGLNVASDTLLPPAAAATFPPMSMTPRQQDTRTTRTTTPFRARIQKRRIIGDLSCLHRE